MSENTSVEVTLGGDIYVLQPKLSAMKAVNRMAGGYTGAFQRISAFDADAMAAIIVAGTGASGQKAKDILDAVYLNGVDELAVPLTRFINICAAGGRDPDQVKRPADDEAAAGKN